MNCLARLGADPRWPSQVSNSKQTSIASHVATVRTHVEVELGTKHDSWSYGIYGTEGFQLQIEVFCHWQCDIF
jgi:hypothetical protein